MQIVLNSAKVGKIKRYIYKKVNGPGLLGADGRGFQDSVGREGRELSFLTAWGEKHLFTSLVEPARRLQYLLPDGRRLEKLREGWLGSPTVPVALRVRRVLYMSSREGRVAPMMPSAALTMRWRDLRQDEVQDPYPTVTRLVRMLSTVPL